MILQSDTANSQFIFHDDGKTFSTTVPGATVSADLHSVFVPFASVTSAPQIDVNTLAGNDNFTVDYSLVSGGSVSPGDTIQYFVVAQDNAGTPNVTSNPLAGASGFTANPPAVSTPPNPPNSYLILYTISGSKNVGVGGDYATLTDAVNALNNSVITGPVTFVLTDPSYTGQPTVNEAFPLVINANSGSSATNTVTFKPASGVTVSITGSSASALFTLNGADYMTIDGSNAGTSSRDQLISPRRMTRRWGRKTARGASA